jgi:hypothetical protein
MVVGRQVVSATCPEAKDHHCWQCGAHATARHHLVKQSGLIAEYFTCEGCVLQE